jgi:CheY-like chemotaxis protein
MTGQDEGPAEQSGERPVLIVDDAINQQELLEAGPSLRIMIVEDDRIIQALFEQFLRKCGHHVSVGSSGEEALSLFKSGPFELVITDLSLSDMSGLSLGKQLKQSNPGVRIILCTGLTLQQGEKELHEAVIDMVIQKPIRLAELFRAIEKSMGLREKNCEKCNLDTTIANIK